MAEVTEADREKAAALALPLRMGFAYEPVIRFIATALAEEREKARAPFLALAEGLWDEVRYENYDDWDLARYVTGRIREVAEETE